MIGRYRRLVWLSIIRTLFGAVLIFLIPIVSITGSETQRIGAYSIALLFWVSLLAEIIITRICTRERKRLEHEEYYSRRLRYASFGLISFFKNREGSIADIVLFLSAIYIAIILWCHMQTGWMILLGVDLFFLSFNMHCILNGRNYRYYKNYKEHVKKQRGAQHYA